MAITFVQETDTGGAVSGTTASCAFGSNITTGNLIVVFISYLPTDVPVITDSHGNTYHHICDDNAAGYDIALYYAWNVTGGANTISATWTTNTTHTIVASEFSGAQKTSDPLDRSNVTLGGSGTPTSTGLAPGRDAELIISACASNGALTAGSGFTLCAAQSGQFAMEYEVQTAATAVAPTFTLSTGTWGQLNATFLPPPPNGNGIYYVQEIDTGAAASGPTVTLTFRQPNKAHSLIVIFLNAAASGGATPTISDSQGNTYHHAVDDSGFWGAAIYYAYNVAAGANTITVTYPSSGAYDVIAVEYQGAQWTADPLDQKVSTTGSAGGTITSTSVTTTTPGQLIFSGLYNQAGITSYSQSGFTCLAQFPWNATSAQYEMLAAAGAVTASYGVNAASWSIQVATFKPQVYLVQHNSSNTNPANVTATTTYTSAQTSGHMNLVFISYNQTAGVTISSVTDTTGNTYHLVATADATNPYSSGASPQHAAMYYAWNIGAAAANANTVTVTFSNANYSVLTTILEYSGLLSASDPLDTSATVSSDSAGAGGSGTVSLTTAGLNELVVISNISYYGQYTGTGTGFTLRDNGQFYEATVDSSVPLAGSVSDTTSWNSATSIYAMIAAAFKTLQSSAPPPPPFGGCAYEC